MPVTVTDYTPAIRNQTKQRASIFLRIMSDNIVDISTPKTPMKLGFLRRGVLKSVSGLHGKVEWRTNYAAVQEVGSRKGKPFKNYTTPGTGPHFAENAVRRAVENTNAVAKLANLI